MSNLEAQCKTVADTVAAYVREIRAGFHVPIVDGIPISEYPLEVVDERGRQFAVVISTGGPHIEVVADGGRDARLEGYWWGERHTMADDDFSVFLDYFIDRTDYR